MPARDTRTGYDVALSFAGEDRPYVEAVAKALTAANVRVFYDGYETVELWGKNLYQHLSEVYSSAGYCVTFISRSYASKLWTRHELEIIQARAFQENREYILPVRFDDTKLPGIQPTTGYIDLRTVAPEELAALIVKKVGVRDEVASTERPAAPAESVEGHDGAAPEFDREALRAFLRDNHLVRQLDQEIASFTRSGRLDERRDAPLHIEMASLRIMGIRTLDALEVALGARRKIIREWAAESLRGAAGAVGRGVSLTYLAYAVLSEWRDVERLERYIRVCRIAPAEDCRVVATRIIDAHIRLTR